MTELITGQDLVEWQLRVADGQPLPLQQHQLSITGHAMEVRLYAEDPSRDYMPSIGTLHHLQAPTQGPHVRVDTGVRQGDTITVHYDPMIAKLIVWDRDRPEAVRRLQAALREYEVAGVQTNLDLLRRIAAHPAFLAAQLDTGFLGRHADVLTPQDNEPPIEALAGAAADALAQQAAEARRVAEAGTDRHSPWTLATAWRLNEPGYQDFVLRRGGAEYRVRAYPRPDGSFVMEAGDRRADVACPSPGVLAVNGVHRRVTVTRTAGTLLVTTEGVTWAMDLADPLAPPGTDAVGGDRLIAPMPGRIISVDTAPGASIRRGDVLVVLESMKVQMRLSAPRDGVVATVRAQAGALVDDGAELVVFEAAP